MDPLFALSVPNWLQASGNVLANTVCWIVIAIGFIFTFLPVIPGQVIILGGALLHFFWLGPEKGMSWTGLTIITIIMLLSFLLDYMAGAAGAKKFGATKWGVWGALLGGVIGIFLGPFGLLLGPLFGAIAFELLGATVGAMQGKMKFTKHHLTSATKSGYGTLLGTLAGVLLKGVAAVMMVGVIFLDILNKWW